MHGFGVGLATIARTKELDSSVTHREGPSSGILRPSIRRVDDFKYVAITPNLMWVVVNIRVPFWVPIIIRHLVFRVPKRDLNFDNYSY